MLFLVAIVLLCSVSLNGAQNQDDIQLYKGSNSSGIVQIYDDGTWKTLCGTNFGETEAQVVCRSLNYADGSPMPYTAFGKVGSVKAYADVFSGNGCATGSEPNIFACDLDRNVTCADPSLNYASVSCYDITENVEDYSIKLADEGTADSGYFSRVLVYKNNTWGYVCAQYWDDEDAQVVCGHLGFQGGVAAYSFSDWSLPTLLMETVCNGTEETISDCNNVDVECLTDKVGDVVCYNSQRPTLELLGGKDHYGYVTISVDNQQGFICGPDPDSVYEYVYTVCKTLGYSSGFPISGVEAAKLTLPNINEVFLEELKCTFDDQTIYECENTDWKVVTGKCDNLTNVASVYCYTSVRLSSFPAVFEQPDIHMGRVEILVNGWWRSVCADTFTQTEADIVCMELGFSHAEISLPGNFGNGYYLTQPIERLECNGTEDSLSNCSYIVGYCTTDGEHSAVICTQNDVVNSVGNQINFTLSEGYHGEVIAERYGVKGRVCPDDWDDNHADVFCRSIGFVTGFTLGSPAYTYRTNPIWATGFVCGVGSDKLDECGYRSDLSEDWSCADDYTVAGVLCYSGKPPDPKVRGEGSLVANHFLVEIYHDVTLWGTVCYDSSWSNAAAHVYCRELGYPYGETATSGFSKGQSNQPIVLSGVRCKGTETSILQCTNNGWLSNSSVCTNHARDVGVYCYSWVKVTPAVTHGAVLYHGTDDYGLVCADGFDDNSARVVCSNQESIQFQYGIALCCSGIGPLTEVFTLSNVSCVGNEKSLRECSYNDKNPTCSSGQYATVACGTVQIGYTKLAANPVVEVTYFSQTGYVCSEGFTDQDATVVCKQLGYSQSAKFKASASAYTNNIRWLRGFGCQGDESSILQCSSLDWGNIGLCLWDSVAAVRCTNNLDDLEFDIRIVDGTDISGRVELKIDNQWGTLCGNDLTKNEARVICRQLGYHDGVAMAPGNYGAGQGPVHLSGFNCQGTESKITDCIWDGYRSVSSLCSHAVDAAVTCLENIRLAGSTTPNYGRLEVYNFNENDWVAVCDNSIFRNEAQLICKQLGYADGLIQFGSPLGPTDVKILVTAVECPTLSKCTFNTGECLTNRYAAVYCSDSLISNENPVARLPEDAFYGPVSIQRYKLWGHICNTEFDDKDATVICKEYKYQYGRALKTYKTQGFPIILGNISCPVTAYSIADCYRDPFIYDHGCYNEDTVAGALCYNTRAGLTLSSTSLNTNTGTMTTIAGLELNSETLRFDYTGFTDIDAAVYCETLNYAGGEVYRSTQGGYGITQIGCKGTEGSILDCPGTWDPSSTDGKQGDLAGVICYTAVRLVGGDPAFYGVVYTSKGVKTGPVCSAGFDDMDAGVACKSLNYNSGQALCCSPFGVVEDTAILTNMQCDGTERQFTDCVHDNVATTSTEVCQRNYAAVVCYNTPKPTDYRLYVSGSTGYTGHVIVSYLGVNGSICLDGWGDNSAGVICRELGYTRGVAYTAARSSTSPGPFWMSNVQCTGNEARLSDCQLTEQGRVNQCLNLNTQAGVICFDNEGIFYRLGGTDELRYGRVELSIHGEWRSVCNLFWHNEDSHVLCTMLGFSTGEVYSGAINGSLLGPVWEVNYQCEGTESDLNLCVSTGWRVSTQPTCTQHTNDAAAFCYKSVKLSTGVGRETDQGAVLLYKDDRWNKVCCDRFNDTSAAVVCKELGFRDGQALGCSSFGDLTEFTLLMSHKIACSGEETDVRDCLISDTCTDDQYAAVVCYAFVQATEPPTEEEKKFDPLPIIIAVVLFVVLLVIAIIVAVCVVKYRRRQKIEKSKQNFDNTILSENVDGTIVVENRLSGLMGTPQLQPRVQYSRNTDSVNSEPEIVYNNGMYSGLKRSTGHDNHGYSNLHDVGASHNTNTSNDYLVPVYHHQDNPQSVDIQPDTYKGVQDNVQNKVPEPISSKNSAGPSSNRTVINVSGNKPAAHYDNVTYNKDAGKSNNTDKSVLYDYNNALTRDRTRLSLSQQDDIQLTKDSVNDSNNDLQASGKMTDP